MRRDNRKDWQSPNQSWRWTLWRGSAELHVNKTTENMKISTLHEKKNLYSFETFFIIIIIINKQIKIPVLEKSLISNIASFI